MFQVSNESRIRFRVGKQTDYNNWFIKNNSTKMDLSSSRTTRAIDARSQYAKRLLPYLEHSRAHHPNFKIKRRSAPKEVTETHVRRYDQSDATTILSIRFASSDAKEKRDREQQMFIKSKKKMDNDIKEQQNQNDDMLPYLKYKKYESPQQYLRNRGYDPDVRIASEVYMDKIEERKVKYVNKMEALKRQLDGCHTDNRYHRMQKSRIQVKILGEEIRRKRQRQIMQNQERKGHRMLHSLLNPMSQPVVHESITL